MSKCACETSVDASALQRSERRILIVVLGINVVTFVMMVMSATVTNALRVLSVSSIGLLLG